MKGWQKIGFIIVGVLFCFLVIVTYVHNDSKPSPKPIVSKPISTPVDEPIEVGKDVYVTDNMNDENSASVTESPTALSYWYVYYTTHLKSGSEYYGYKVIQLSTPYFTINEARKKIVPSAIDDDYIGIQYFKRVPVETFLAANKTDK